MKNHRRCRLELFPISIEVNQNGPCSPVVEVNRAVKLLNDDRRSNLSGHAESVLSFQGRLYRRLESVGGGTDVTPQHLVHLARS